MSRTLCEEYDRRKQKEKEMNVRKEQKKKKEDDAAAKGQGPSRTVTEIDYRKHEDTVKELARQEKDEEFARKKAEASQWCTLDHEHGPQCRRPVGGCSHDHQKEWAIYERSTEEKIAAADRFRQEGNEAYRKHNYGLAAVHYRKALLQFDYTFAEGEAEEKAADDVKVPCLLNLAACKCHQEEWDEVVTQCRLALEINPRAVKAYYRTGLAHLARDNWDLAKDALMSAHEIEPQNHEVLQALRQLKNKKETYKVRTKEVAKEMLSGRETHETKDDSAQAEVSQTSPDDARGCERPAEAAATVPAETAEVASRASQTRAQEEEAPSGCAIAESLGGTAASETVSGGTLRQRRGASDTGKSSGVPAPEDDVDEDDAEVDDDVDEDDAKVLNTILMASACLGVVAVLGFGALYFYED